jgi:hypothetical protein
MEVVQGPNWGCSAKGKNKICVGDCVKCHLCHVTEQHIGLKGI